MVDPVHDDAERGDAPRESAAHSRVRYHKEFDGYCFSYYKQGKRIRIQTTVKAAVGSRSEAARICRLCYLRCEEGWPKEKIIEYRNALYVRIGGCAPKQMGPPYLQQGKAPQGKKEAGEPPAAAPAPPRPPPPRQEQQQRGGKKSLGEEEEEDEEEEEAQGEAEAEAEDEEEASHSEGEEADREGAAETGPQADKPELTPVISEDAPPESKAHSSVRFQKTKGVFCFEVRTQGNKYRMQTTTKAAGGCYEDAARIARLCYHRMMEAGESKQAVLAYRNALYERCAELRSPWLADEEEDEEAAEEATDAGSMRTPDGASQLSKKRKRVSEMEIVCRSLVDGGETVLVTPNKVMRKTLPGLAQLEVSDIELLTADEIYYYERILGLSSRRQREDRVVRLERLAQRNTLPGRQTSQERLSSIQEFLARSEAERRSITLNELKRLERCAFIPDSENLSLPERKLRLQEQLWASRSAKPEEASSSFFAGWKGSDEQATQGQREAAAAGAPSSN